MGLEAQMAYHKKPSGQVELRTKLVKSQMFIAEIDLTAQMFCPFQAARFLN